MALKLYSSYMGNATTPFASLSESKVEGFYCFPVNVNNIDSDITRVIASFIDGSTAYTWRYNDYQVGLSYSGYTSTFIGQVSRQTLNTMFKGFDDPAFDEYISRYVDSEYKERHETIYGYYSGDFKFKNIVNMPIPKFNSKGSVSYLGGINYVWGFPIRFIFDGEVFEGVCGTALFRSNDPPGTSRLRRLCFVRKDGTFIQFSGINISELLGGKKISFSNSFSTPDFMEWIAEYTEQLFSNTYTIKSQNGVEILANAIELPNMKKARIYVLGNIKTLIFTGTNDNEYTIEWNSETPEGKTFGGLSLTAGNGSIYIPSNGEDIDINLDGSTTLYESYQTYRPLEDPFTILLYQNSSEPHRVDKTDFLTEVGGYSGIFRDSANIVNPIIRIQANDIPNFNYVKIGILNRYYFVTDYDIVRTGLIDLYLTEDVLMTYREGIYKLQAFIERNQYANNPYLIDKKRVIEEGINVEVYSIENELMSNTTFQPDTDLMFVLNGYKIDSADQQQT